MGIKITPAKDVSINIEEPKRGDFPDNLGGAVEFTLTKFIYHIFRLYGEAIGAFLGGTASKFLDDLEPKVLEYARPILDWIINSPDTPKEIRDFVSNLRSGKYEIGTILTNSLVGSAVGSSVGSITQALTEKWTQAIMKWIRPTIMTPAEAVRAMYLRAISYDEHNDFMARNGIPESYIPAYDVMYQTFPSLEAFFEYLRRNPEREGYVRDWLFRLGVDAEEFNWWPELRWNRLSPDAMFTAYYRLQLPEVTLNEYLLRTGWKAPEVDYLKAIYRNLPPLQDIIRFAVREAWRDDISEKWGYDEEYPSIVEEYIKRLGYDPDIGKRYWRAHWELPSVTLGMEMVHRGIITEAEFKELLKIADYPAGWRDKMTKAIYTPFTRVDVRRMYKLGVLNYDEMVRAYMDLGYDETKAKKLADFTVKYEMPDTDTKPEKYRQLSLSILQKAYRKGLIKKDELKKRLLELGYDEDEAQLIVDLTDLETTVDQTPDYYDTYQNTMKKMIVDAYSSGLLEVEKAKSLLQSIGITDTEIDYLMTVADFRFSMDYLTDKIKMVGDAYVEGRMDRFAVLDTLGKLGIPGDMQERLFTIWDAKISVPSRQLTEAQYRQAVIDGSISLDEYREALQVLRYSEKDSGILVDRLLVSLSPANLKRLIKIGKIDVNEYVNTMKRLGYEKDEIEKRLS